MVDIERVLKRLKELLNAVTEDGGDHPEGKTIEIGDGGTDDGEVPDTEDEEEVKESGTNAENDSGEENDTSGDDSDGDGVPVTDVKGVGPAYADRLSDAGVENVSDLAKEDPEALAEQTEISESRVETWIDRAGEDEN